MLWPESLPSGVLVNCRPMVRISSIVSSFTWQPYSSIGDLNLARWGCRTHQLRAPTDDAARRG